MNSIITKPGKCVGVEMSGKLSGVSQEMVKDGDRPLEEQTVNIPALIGMMANVRCIIPKKCIPFARGMYAELGTTL